MSKHIYDLFLDHHQTWNHLTINIRIAFTDGPGGQYGFIIGSWSADLDTDCSHCDTIVLSKRISRIINRAALSPYVTQIKLKPMKNSTQTLIKTLLQKKCFLARSNFYDAIISDSYLRFVSFCYFFYGEMILWR